MAETVTMTAARGGGYDVWAKAGEERIARLVLVPVQLPHVEPDCHVADLVREVKRWHPRASIDLWAVESVSVWPAWNGQGWGLALYHHALSRFAENDARVAIVMQGRCADGSTSPDAERIWKRLAADWMTAPEGRAVASLAPKPAVSEIEEYLHEQELDGGAEVARTAELRREFTLAGGPMADPFAAVRDATLRNMPEGEARDYAAGFFERHEAVLRAMVRQALAVHRPPVAAELDPEQHRICASCGHVAHVEALGPHLGMPSIGLACPISFGWGRIRPNDRLDQSIWNKYVSDATAAYGTCGECRGFFRVRPHRELGLVLTQHYRAPRKDTEPRKRKNVPCEGSGTRPV